MTEIVSKDLRTSYRTPFYYPLRSLGAKLAGGSEAPRMWPSLLEPARNMVNTVMPIHVPTFAQ